MKKFCAFWLGLNRKSSGIVTSLPHRTSRHSDALHALFGEVEVGRQQFAVEAELIALAAGGKLFLTGRLLADGTLVHIVDGFVEFLALGAQALGAVFLGVIAFQHRVEGGPLLDEIFLAILLGVEEGVLHRFAVRSGDAARTAARVVDLFQLVDGRHQPDLLGLRQLVGQQMFSVKGTPCGLAADHRADAGHRFVQSVCHRQVALAATATMDAELTARKSGRAGLGGVV